MCNISITVIIPVYNAEKYIEEAVNSCLKQELVHEILLIEDRSEDNSLSICKKLADYHNKVKLYTHPNGENKGPGESRNLGIKKANCSYIAFLDADDYYGDNRFRSIHKKLKENSYDGFYETVGVKYESIESEKKHKKRMFISKKNIKTPKLPLDYTGIESTLIPSSKLFFHLLKSDYGWIHLNGLTIKKSSLKNFTLFNTNFLGQDAEFIKRLSAEKKLISSGNLEPVAYRRVHNENRILKKSPKKINKFNVDNSYWLWYCVEKRIIGKELFYLLKQQNRTHSTITKLVNMTINLSIVIIGIIFRKRFKLLN